MGNSNFLVFFMIGILVTTAWGTSVLLSSMNEEWQGPQPDINVRTAYQGQNGLTLTMTNNGEAANFSKFELKYRIDNQVYTHEELKQQLPSRALNTTCFGGTIYWKNSVTYRCQTGIKFPQATERVTLIISYAEGEMKWRKVCQPPTDTAVGC
ncbi:hypothetical protein GKQ38_00020 [Candidatus Nanohaloarchaea archaeon]|nr:hypothetical protein GKQ38_00020 [Candidatus Nanohaloarchaea archaeon]